MDHQSAQLNPCVYFKDVKLEEVFIFHQGWQICMQTQDRTLKDSNFKVQVKQLECALNVKTNFVSNLDVVQLVQLRGFLELFANKLLLVAVLRCFNHYFVESSNSD